MKEGFSLIAAFEIASKTFSYTNHPSGGSAENGTSTV
jgi:glucan phosphorylase